MKLKVEYVWPRVSVNEIIDVGNVKNMTLNERQNKKVSAAVKRLSPDLLEKMREQEPKVKLTYVD